KTAFRAEGWVDNLVKSTVALADKYEASEQWLKALRVYQDLGAIEPSKPEWKDRLKLAMRRIRLLALYAPDTLKQIQEAEAKDRAVVEALLKPATQPTTQEALAPGATTQPTTQQASI